MLKRLLLALFIGCSSPALADDRSEIISKAPKGSHILLVRVARPWALIAYHPQSLEGGCTYLLRRSGGQWRPVFGGGGALGAGEIFDYGVGRAYWPGLLNYRPTPEDVKAAMGHGPLWPRDSREPLESGDIEGLSGWELTLRRNEVYARHGYIFRDPEMRAYFTQRSWYRPRRNFRESDLTAVERENVRLMHDYQKREGRFE